MYDFSCLLTRLPEPLASAIRDAGRRIDPADVYNSDGDHGLDERPHVTVKFGIHTDEPQEVLNLVGSWSPFWCRVGRVSTFNAPNNVVLKLEIQSEDLVRMNRDVSGSLECTDTHPEYKPHCTLAYLVQREDDPYYFQKYMTHEFDGVEFRVEDVEFSTPDGREYTMALNGNMGAVAERVARGVVARHRSADENIAERDAKAAAKIRSDIEGLFDDIIRMGARIETELSDFNSPGLKRAFLMALRIGASEQRGFSSGKAQKILARYFQGH